MSLTGQENDIPFTEQTKKNLLENGKNVKQAIPNSDFQSSSCMFFIFIPLKLKFWNKTGIVQIHPHPNLTKQRMISFSNWNLEAKKRYVEVKMIRKEVFLKLIH